MAGVPTWSTYFQCICYVGSILPIPVQDTTTTPPKGNAERSTVETSLRAPVYPVD